MENKMGNPTEIDLAEQDGVMVIISKTEQGITVDTGDGEMPVESLEEALSMAQSVLGGQEEMPESNEREEIASEVYGDEGKSNLYRSRR